MKQTFNIFVKDVRLFYPEILISLLVMVAFVKLYPQQWGAPGVGMRGVTWLPGAVTGLVPVTWWLLIARAVHAESLVGERQFWITRPYRWPSLLAAKALFIFAFVWVPFSIAQCVLLREAGFAVSPHFYGLGFNLTMGVGIVILPLMAFAAVTSTFPRMLLAVVILLAYGAGMAYLDTLLPTSSGPDSSSDQLQFIVVVVGLVLVIVIQYASRATFMSRIFLAVLALTIGVMAMFSPEETPMRLTYPADASKHPTVQLAFAPIVDYSSGLVAGESNREVELSLPVEIAGIKHGTAIKADYAKVRINSADGEHWESHWQSLYLTWLPGEEKATVSLKIGRPFFERAKGKLATVDLSLALTTIQMGGVTHMSLPQGAFEIPGGSICNVQGVWRDGLSCRSALRQPPLMLVGTRFSTKPCSEGSAMPDGDEGIGWIGNLSDDPADFGVTSVWTSSVYFQRGSSENSNQEQHLCPGSTLSFASYTVLERSQQRITGPSVRLGSLSTDKAM